MLRVRDMTTRSSPRRLLRGVGRVGVLAVAGVLLAACGDDSTREINPLDPQGTVAKKQIGLLEFWMIPAAIIGVGVLGATVFVALRFRERPGNENPKQIHGNTTLEIGWTIVPALIMAAMAVPTVALIWELDEKPANPLEVTVYGKQWWWEYQYTNLGDLDPTIDFQVNTANELHIPPDQAVYFTLKSNNVIHSFWVPSLAGKKDVVPGRENHMWLIADKEENKGRWYFGQCVEYCGLSHADMRLRVFVHETNEDFLTWARAQHEPWSEERLARADELGITSKWGCTSCHYIGGLDEGNDAAIASGTGANTRPGPNLTHLADRVSFAGAKYDLDPDKLTEWIWHAPELKPAQCDKSVARSGSETCVGMPNFEKSNMTEDEARAIAAFLMESEQ